MRTRGTCDRCYTFAVQEAGKSVLQPAQTDDFQHGLQEEQSVHEEPAKVSHVITSKHLLHHPPHVLEEIGFFHAHRGSTHSQLHARQQNRDEDNRLEPRVSRNCCTRPPAGGPWGNDPERVFTALRVELNKGSNWGQGKEAFTHRCSLIAYPHQHFGLFSGAGGSTVRGVQTRPRGLRRRLVWRRGFLALR